MKLIIVESPTKARTISRFLGKDFLVESSYGHIRDLPEKKLGVEVENDFEPQYVVPVKAKPKVQALKKAQTKAKQVILATDEDREGESIAFHLAYVLDLKNPQRIVFHEITKPAIETALENPRTIDLNLVNAQQARRVLDRLVGYKLSPFLWKKIMRGLSAGRVQSVAVRIICDREKEIENFVESEYWSIAASLLKAKTENELQAVLTAENGKPVDKLEIKNKEQAEKILKNLQGGEWRVDNVEKKEIIRNPLPPFTTSTLQQTASTRFRYSAKKTMVVAQQLYEQGLITYHRTDSVNLSGQSQAAAKEFIEKNFGKNYWPGYARNFKTKSKTAQEAHEAIRPTYPGQNTPEKITKSTPEQKRLYTLIWQRFVASQMTEAKFAATKVDVEAKNPNAQTTSYTFSAAGQTLLFDGFLKAYPAQFEETELPELEKGELLVLKELLPKQHFTTPPDRFTEAALIKTLEKAGIGRPSTYAPIMDTIQKRNYVEKDKERRLKPTQTGVMVNDLLVLHFPQIVEIGFTSEMEENLDRVAEGKKDWKKLLADFYFPFEKILKEKEKTVEKKDLTEKTDRICPQCQKPLIIRAGRFGRFYACSGFPNCKHTEALPKPSLGVKCPKCATGDVVEKNTKTRKTFYGCSNWPKCDFALWDKPVQDFCPRCRSIMMEKNKKIVCSNQDCELSVKKRYAGISKKNKKKT
ncbi:MAG: type I DNA topoisomerase [Patescibacteria group bacterium]|nr:type I DNA topoisomerase [Patescibacteria group bacterium]